MGLKTAAQYVNEWRQRQTMVVTVRQQALEELVADVIREEYERGFWDGTKAAVTEGQPGGARNV